MMSFAHRGFVFLTTTKTGSTAIHRGFRKHCSVEVRSPPKMKHLTVRGFNQVWVPLLEHHGYPRESYELVAIIREPVDWVGSWWRYRSRPAVRNTPNWTGDTPFEAFAEQVMSGEVQLGHPGKFVTDASGQLAVERLYRYENLGDAVDWMAAKIGIEAPDLRQTNPSPRREMAISPALRSRLEEHFSAAKRLYEGAR